MVPDRPKRVAILWEQWTGYLDASARTLVAKHGVALFRSHLRPVAASPLDPDAFLPAETFLFDGAPDTAALTQAVEGFQPDLALIASWHRPAYRHAARRLKGRAVRVVGMDNQWRGTAKQWLGVVSAPVFVQPLFDRALVAGDRQRRFARKLGFAADRIATPLYSCDQPAFEAAGARAPSPRPGAFLVAARLVADKGIDTLAAAYRRYRAQAGGAAWPLLVAGTGPQRGLLQGIDGVEMLGFVQTDALPALFARVGCFVLPSRFEAWGVVLHEAASVGLPLICTTACGAGDAFLRDEVNGYLVPPDDPGALAGAMALVAGWGAEAALTASERSRVLSRDITPERFADALWAAMAGG